MNKTICFKALLLTAWLAVCTLPALAKDGNEYTRERGIIARIGAGAPTHLDLGLGYRFNPHFVLSAEAFSYSGMTTVTGVLDARYHFIDKEFSPFVDVKSGYGTMGKNIEYQNIHGILESVTAGLSWRRFDLGAGIIHDHFHGTGFIANLSWTYGWRSAQSR